jgi:hypothetical protein
LLHFLMFTMHWPYLCITWFSNFRCTLVEHVCLLKKNVIQWRCVNVTNCLLMVFMGENTLHENKHGSHNVFWKTNKTDFQHKAFNKNNCHHSKEHNFSRNLLLFTYLCSFECKTSLTFFLWNHMNGSFHMQLKCTIYS